MKFGDKLHLTIQEEYKIDKDVQKELYEQFTKNPPNLREHLGKIEASAMGFFKKDGQFVNDKGDIVSESELERIEMATDKVMLRTNPDIERNYLQYTDNLFYPLSVEVIREMERVA